VRYRKQYYAAVTAHVDLQRVLVISILEVMSCAHDTCMILYCTLGFNKSAVEFVDVIYVMYYLPVQSCIVSITA